MWIPQENHQDNERRKDNDCHGSVLSSIGGNLLHCQDFEFRNETACDSSIRWQLFEEEDVRSVACKCISYLLGTNARNRLCTLFIQLPLSEYCSPFHMLLFV
jgi:hypothetical protein